MLIPGIYTLLQAHVYIPNYICSNVYIAGMSMFNVEFINTYEHKYSDFWYHKAIIYINGLLYVLLGFSSC